MHNIESQCNLVMDPSLDAATPSSSSSPNPFAALVQKLRHQRILTATLQSERLSSFRNLV